MHDRINYLKVSLSLIFNKYSEVLFLNSKLNYLDYKSNPIPIKPSFTNSFIISL